MTPETLIQIQNIIEKFGFPVFVALCGLLLFAIVFRYMTKAIEKNAPSVCERGFDVYFDFSAQI